MHERICPNCQYPLMKTWEELTDDEKFVAERLPLSASLTPEQRKKNLFCPRCRHEQIPNLNEIV